MSKSNGGDLSEVVPGAREKIVAVPALLSERNSRVYRDKVRRTHTPNGDRDMMRRMGQVCVAMLLVVAACTEGTAPTEKKAIVGDAPTQNQSPVAHITTPTGGNVFAPAAGITFTGTGTDAEDGTLTGASLVWTDNVSGPIGTGTSFSLATLAEGPHTITLTVTDSKGATGTATVSMTIGFSQSIGTAGGSLCVESCHLSFYFPPGALSSTVNFVVYNVPDAPVPPANLLGGAVVISPLVNLAIAGEVGIGYDPATLPSGIPESSLRLFQFISGSWHELTASGVNTTSHIVYGQTSITGVFAIVGGL